MAAPPFRCIIEKYQPSQAEYWTNVYWINVADLEAANTVAASIMAAERPLYWNGVTITKTRVDDNTPNTDQFITVPQNLLGTRTTPASNNAPLWVTARVDFAVAGNGRPSRKYLRGVLFEEDFDSISLVTAVKNLLQTYANTIAGLAVCDPDLQDITSGAPFNSPQMRQLRRGSKKPVTP